MKALNHLSLRTHKICEAISSTQKMQLDYHTAGINTLKPFNIFELAAEIFGGAAMIDLIINNRPEIKIFLDWWLP